MSLTYPLTSQQEGLWVEHCYNPDDSSYHTCVQVKLEGNLDEKRFCQAASDVIAHTPLLRSYCIAQDNGKAMLAISEQRFSLDYIDISHTNADPLTLLDDIRQKPIDLTRFPLIHAALIKKSDTCYYFIGVVPHIISDGVSAIYFLQSLSLVYNQNIEAFTAKESAKWEDYLSYLSQHTSKHQEATQYWQQHLQHAQHRTAISDTPTNQLACKRHAFSLSSTTLTKLKKLSFSMRTSLFTLLSGLFAACLQRYVGQEDYVIGYPVNVRPAGFAQCFGFFVNILPLTVHVTDHTSFVDLFSAIHQQRKNDKPHQHLPSLDIVRAKRASDPHFDGRLCNVSMAQTVSRMQGLELDNITSTAIDHEAIEAKDDLSFMYELSNDGMHCWFEYNNAQLDDSFIHNIARCFTTLTHACLDDAKQPIGKVTIAEQPIQHLPSPKSPEDLQCLHHYIEHVAATKPDNIAIMDQDATISFKYLNASANGLAQHLIHHNIVSSKAPVALILPPSKERIIVQIALLKLGIPFVPIDSHTPIARIHAIINDCQAHAIIVEEAIDTDMTVCQCVLSQHPWQEKDENPNHTSLEDLAYIIYTSGSTGTPKGVMVSHKALSYRMNWMLSTFALSTGDCVLHHTNYSFDVSIAEIFWPLASGASLVIAPENTRKDISLLAKMFDKHNIKAACAVPSLIKAILSHKPHAFMTLKYMLAAGEALEQHVVDSFYQSIHGATLYNVYGPTEGTIYASIDVCAPNNKTTTIGHAIDHTELYVLNNALESQPLHAVGELFIGGPALASGYINNQKLTNKLFMDHPNHASKLYRTGDLVRLNHENKLEYLGRKDHQIKLRGYRIELGEIHNTLLKLPSISDATSIVYDNKQLISYVVAKALDEQDIKRFLATSLPDYMIPHRIIAIDHMPLLPSGKVNRHALPSPDRSVVDSDHFVAPSTQDEITLCNAIAHVLRIDPKTIGLESDFFALGGDSLMTIEVTCEAQKHGLEINPQTLFLKRTVASTLATTQDTLKQSADQSTISGSINILPRHARFFASNFSNASYWNRTLLIEFSRAPNISLLEKSFQHVITHHDGLRLQFSNHRAFIAPQAAATITLHAKDTVLKDVLEKAHACIDICKAPLMALHYIHTGKRSGILVCVIHHLLVDMRSCRILLEDVIDCYKSYMAGSTPDLAPKTTSLDQFATYLTHYNASHEIPYWQDQLRDANQHLPLKHLEEKVSLPQSKQVSTSFSISKASSKILSAIAKQYQTNLHEVILSQFAYAYKQWCHAPVLSVNTCHHGRMPENEAIDISRTIGWINTVFPVKIDLTSNTLLPDIHNSLSTSPHMGMHYSALRFIHKAPAITGLAEPLIFYNYVSKIDTTDNSKLPAKLIENPTHVPDIDPNNQSCYALYIDVALVKDCIHVSLSYNLDAFDEPHITQLIRLFKEQLSGARH